jgi:hypothetical protein
MIRPVALNAVWVDFTSEKFQYFGSGLADFGESTVVGKVIRYVIRFYSLHFYILHLVDTT